MYIVVFVLYVCLEKYFCKSSKFDFVVNGNGLIIKKKVSGFEINKYMCV